MDEFSMKFFSVLALSFSMIILTGCNKMPKECNDAWDKLESFGKQMGVPEDQIKVQKEKFVKEVTAMKPEQAKEQCSMQNSIMGMVGQ